MFNFGFGDLVDRFEKHFGRTLTKVLMGFVTVVFVVFLLTYLVTDALYPLVLWIGDIASGNPAMDAARGGVNWIASILAAVVAIAFVVALFQARGQLSVAAEVLNQVQDAKLVVEDLAVKVKGVTADAEVLTKSAIDATEKANAREKAAIALAEKAIATQKLLEKKAVLADPPTPPDPSSAA